MNTKQQLHQAKLTQWAARFKEQAASGLTVKMWCEQNNLSIHSYNYWKHQLKAEYIESLLPEIVPVSLPSATEPYQPVANSSELSDSRDSRNSSDSCNSNNSCSHDYLRISTPDIDISASSNVPDAILLELIKAVRHA